MYFCAIYKLIIYLKCFYYSFYHISSANASQFNDDSKSVSVFNIAKLLSFPVSVVDRKSFFIRLKQENERSALQLEIGMYKHKFERDRLTTHNSKLYILK